MITTDTVGTISTLVRMMAPLFMVPTILLVVLLALKFFVLMVEEHSKAEESKPVPLKPSKAVKKMISTIDGDVEPDWMEKLVRYEKQGIADSKVKNMVEKMEKVFTKEYERFLENHKEFKKLAVRTDGNLADIAERMDDNPVMMELAKGLSKQKVLVLSIAEEILELRIQEDTATRTKKANELAEKMGKELGATRETETVRNTARSVHEEVLQEILASKEATADMKTRAEAMLPHFKSVSPEEEQTEMKRQDYEMDLQTLEKIMDGNLAVPVEKA